MSGESRAKKSIRNAYFNIFNQIIGVLVQFILRTVFIRTLAFEYLGVNGLFSNILSVLSLTELGLGTALVTNILAEYFSNLSSSRAIFKQIAIGTVIFQSHKKGFAIDAVAPLNIGQLGLGIIQLADEHLVGFIGVDNILIGILDRNGVSGIFIRERAHGSHDHQNRNDQSKNLPCYYITPTITFWRCTNATKKP